MNEEIIINMVKPYIKNNSITYNEFDSIYNFGAKEVGISPRNTSYSEKLPTDFVHCDDNGYKRCGDLIFFFVMNVLYNNLNR